MVASGSRKALAISPVSRPPSRRSVSATCESGSERGVAAQKHEPELVVGDDIDETVEGFAVQGLTSGSVSWACIWWAAM